jgi:flagella basal body P-ring formation protein FlgA
MRRTLLAALALAGILSPVLLGTAADAATLRNQVVVDGDVIRLGDLFENPGPRAQVAVANAPAPGRRMVFEVQWLAEVARYYQIGWRPQSRFERVVVERPGRIVTPREIVARLRDSLVEHGMRQDSLVELANRTQDIAVAIDAPETIEIRQLDYDQTAGRFTAVLLVGAGHPSQQRSIVTGRVFPTVPVPVMRRAINPGDVIRAEDIEWGSAREDQLRADAVTSPQQIIGQTPRIRLRPGETIRQGDTQPVVLVNRDSTITIVLDTGSIRLTALGRALDNGSRGQIVRVTNLQSRQTIEGVVAGPDLVTVQLGGRLASPPQVQQ